MNTDHDIVVVGGGLTGSLAALALAHNGFSSVLVDADTPSHMTAAEFDGRTTALAFAAVRLLKRLGLWERLEPVAAPINDILVTDGRADDRFRKGAIATGFLHFDSREIADGDAATPLGWIVENRHLRQAFYDAVDAHSRIDLVAPAFCSGMSARPEGAIVNLTDGREFPAKLIVAADGRRSPLREQARIKTNGWSYDQTGIVCTISHEKDHLGIAQEIFLPAGPFAILPMRNNQSSLVWTEKSDRAQSYMALDDDLFLEEIRRRVGDHLGTVSLAGPRWSYPLGLQLAARFCADRMVLVGDAAHGIHPIAGQGYNLGVKDIAVLCDVLVEASHAGLDIGHGTQLEKYDRWRRFDSTTLAYGTDALNRLMSVDNRLLRAVRSTGMGLVNRIDPLRRMFMRQAGGDLGNLPSLMRP